MARYAVKTDSTSLKKFKKINMKKKYKDEKKSKKGLYLAAFL